MSKITFRADEELIRELETFEASKSEVMRDALRAYIDDSRDVDMSEGEPLYDALAGRVDELIADRLESVFTTQDAQDINVNINLEGVAAEGGEVQEADSAMGSSEDPDREACMQCGEPLSQGAVYCSNCGEKASHRVFCECGDEVRSDWAYCPGCGRRTPAADVLGDP